MGIRLIVEVLDHWKDFGLTAGERGDLIVVAENANDETRTTWGPLHADYILERAGKSAASWKNAIGKLLKKGALEHAVINGRVMAGFHGQYAVYRVAVLCPEAPHDGLRGACTRPHDERVTSQVTQPENDPGKGHLSGDPNRRKGHLSDAERVTSQVTPTPPTPLTTPSSQPTAAFTSAKGGGGGTQDLAQAVALVDALDYRGRQPSRTQRDNLIKHVDAALAAGWSPEALSAYLDLGTAAVTSAAGVYLHRLAPGELPDPPTPQAAPQAKPAWCGHCEDGWIPSDGGVRRCPDCNPGEAA
ncbi:hypothetical protein ACWCRF_11510 [Streptomyces sp. NPDC002405]